MDRDDEEISPAVDYLGTDEDPRIDFEGAQEAMWSHETERIKYLAVASDQGQQQRIACTSSRGRDRAVPPMIPPGVPYIGILDPCRF
jgi:hypothetical protein